MDPRLLRLYTDELTHLREMGVEFAREFPKVASRLGMPETSGIEVADPYVERLLEGFAFLAARVQLKLEAEQPRLISHLLEATYPNFLAPVPSMLVARFTVDTTDPNLADGWTVERGSALRSELPRGQDTRCEFRTAHAVTLWPIELVDVQYFTHAPDLPLTRIAPTRAAKGGLRLRLRAGAGLALRDLGLDKLALYISAPDDVAFRLHELVLGQGIGSWVGNAPAHGASQWRGASSVRPLGFSADEALLPDTLRTFSGYRLLQELAAMPQRFLFFEVGDLAARLAQIEGGEAEIVLLFGRGDPGLEPLIDARSVALHCTPAINLFRKRLDRIQLGPGAWEYHVVPDRTRPMDFEVHSIESVTGFGSGNVGQQDFAPLYDTRHGSEDARAFYTVRREPRLLSQRQKLQGTRSSYVGEEVFLSLVDPRHAPYREDIRQLAVSAWVSNRDLPNLLPPAGSAAPWTLESTGPVQRVEALRGPTRPVSRRPVGDVGWSLVNHLAHRSLPLVDAAPHEAAADLRTMLLLYGPPEDVSWQRQVGGLRTLGARTAVRRLPFAGPLTFGAGVEIDIELDEMAFQGASAFLFASVLERFLARHAAINTFTSLTLRSTQRGEVMRWAPRAGVRETV